MASHPENNSREESDEEIPDEISSLTPKKGIKINRVTGLVAKGPDSVFNSVSLPSLQENDIDFVQSLSSKIRQRLSTIEVKLRDLGTHEKRIKEDLEYIEENLDIVNSANISIYYE